MQVFQHACDACVNPVLALYNHVRERLRCKAVRAFNRILDIADEDQDGALNDDELNHFHEFCFGRSLPIDELNGLKQVPPLATYSMYRQCIHGSIAVHVKVA